MPAYAGPSPKPVPKPGPPERWPGGDVPSEHQDRPLAPTLTDQPVIPRQYPGSESEVSVHTPALRLAGTNIGKLDNWFSEARVRLEHVDVHAGAFYEADALEATVGSQGKDTDKNLKRTSINSVVNWRDTVLAIDQGCTELAKKYDSIEHLNAMTAADFKKGFGNVLDYNQDLLGVQTTGGQNPPAQPPK